MGSGTGLVNSVQFKRLLSVVLVSHKGGRSFADSAKAFAGAFVPHEAFAALSACLLLLEDYKGLLLAQRLAAWYVLYHCWPDGTASNPFICFLVRVCEESGAMLPERALCRQLLAQHEAEKLSTERPWDWALMAPHAKLVAQLLLVSGGDLVSQLAGKYTCLLAQQQQQQQAGQQAGQQQAGQQQQQQAAGGGDGGGALTPQQPQQPQQQEQPEQPEQRPGALPPGTVPWVRPRPPPLPPATAELHWLYPPLHGGLLWDSSLGEDGAEAEAARELATRALRGPLLPAQEQRLLTALAADPRLAHRLGVQPQHLPSLVEHCPAFASALLLRLLRPRPSGRVAELMGVLARSEMSLHGMEVVNRLAASVELPPDFVRLYITNCIQSCEATADKFVQSRLVRLVCVFLQSLIRNRILAAADLLHELQAFCINFSRIKEAAKLFRLLKQMEGSGGSGPMSPTHGSGSGGAGGGPCGSGGAGGGAHRGSGSDAGSHDGSVHDLEGDL